MALRSNGVSGNTVITPVCLCKLMPSDTVRQRHQGLKVRIRCGRCNRIWSPFTPGGHVGPVSYLEVLPPGYLVANPDIELMPPGASRPHLTVLDRTSHRVVIRCACGAEHKVKYRKVMDALMAKQRADPMSRRIDILTSEL